MCSVALQVGSVQIYTFTIEKQSAESVIGSSKRSAESVAEERAKAQAQANDGGGLREWVVQFVPHARVTAHSGWVSRLMFVPELESLISSSEVRAAHRRPHHCPPAATRHRPTAAAGLPCAPPPAGPCRG